MKILAVLILVATFKAALGGGSSLCEPFVSSFQALNQVLLTLLDNSQQYSINISTSIPILATTYATNLKCDTNNAITLAAKAINRLSGVDPSVIINILNSTASEPFVAPLDCIAADLIHLRDLISNIKNNVVPEVAALNQSTQSPVNNCSDAVVRLRDYLQILNTTAPLKVSLVAIEKNLFESVGMVDLYLEYLNNICFWDIVAASYGFLFNTDGSPITEYMNGQSSTLPYPFSCVQFYIDFLNASLEQHSNDWFNELLSLLNSPGLI